MCDVKKRRQLADGLFRIGENPSLPSWAYDVLRDAIAELNDDANGVTRNQATNSRHAQTTPRSNQRTPSMRHSGPAFLPAWLPQSLLPSATLLRRIFLREPAIRERPEETTHMPSGQQRMASGSASPQWGSRSEVSRGAESSEFQRKVAESRRERQTAEQEFHTFFRAEQRRNFLCIGVPVSLLLGLLEAALLSASTEPKVPAQPTHQQVACTTSQQTSTPAIHSSQPLPNH